MRAASLEDRTEVTAKTGSEPICPVCQGSKVDIFAQISNVPVLCNALWPSKQDAINAPQGDIRLGFCRDCHHIYNFAFNPDLMDYSQGYENALHFSHRFQNYAHSLAERLVKRFSLRHKALVEIGCGDGAFLKLLCELGDNCGVGFEPGTDPHSFHAESASQRTRFINDAYSSQYADVPVDFICCRHVLEHIPSPRDFMQHLCEMLSSKKQVKLYFEVPNVRFNLSDHGFWDFIYEHCSYFGANSLEALFRYYGFEILSVTEQYENQFLTIDASHDAGLDAVLDASPGVADPIIGVEGFQTRYECVVENWKHRLAQMREDGLKMVVWGTGSKGVSFLNMLAAQDQIEYVVDINPRKHGRYVAGTGQEIKPPEFLKTYQPDAIS